LPQIIDASHYAPMGYGEKHCHFAMQVMEFMQNRDWAALPAKGNWLPTWQRNRQIEQAMQFMCRYVHLLKFRPPISRAQLTPCF
jgi:hypothetical protein